jgi:YD repeat-containing protein
VTQTRAGQSELLSKMTYNAQHLPLTSTDAAGQTTTYTYNACGQVLTKTNAKNETTTYHYVNKGHPIPVNNGFLESIEGPLPGASTTFTYDAIGRVQTKTDVDGYMLNFEYDNLDRLTKITLPDGTFHQVTYAQLDHTLTLDRAGRQTTFEYNSIRQRRSALTRLTGRPFSSGVNAELPRA